jgi:glycosyltransferase involved in cell wall biosynthesis
MKPKLAVLMCAHNSEMFIRDAIESILNQTYSDYEFIIVENGSTDKTWDIIRSYDDSRIKAFKTELAQLIFNLNYGLLQTDAKLIARMDTDDISEPERLERQMKYLDSYPEVCVLGTALKLFGNNIKSKVIILPETDKKIRRKMPFFFSICHPTVIFRRETIIKYGGYISGKHCEDLDLWLRLSRDKSIKFANLPDVLLKYRINSSQIKGRVEGYAGAAGTLISESLIQKSPRLFLASLFTCLKIFKSSKHI